MKRIFLIMAMLYCGAFTVNAQNDEVIYVKFSSTDKVNSGKIVKNVNLCRALDAEPSVTFILEDKNKGYSMRFSHFRHKREEVVRQRKFTSDEFMEVKRINEDLIRGDVIDLDVETINWTKEDAWEFAKKIEKARKIYFVDKRDTNDGICLIRQVRLISSNRPDTDMIIIDRELQDELKKIPVRNILDQLPDSLRKKQ